MPEREGLETNGTDGRRSNEDTMAWQYGVPAPKPEPRKRTKARTERQASAHVKAIREAVFERESHACRCCGTRMAVSMHEIRPRSLGGAVSLENSIALCGSGTTGCHGFCQRHSIRIHGSDAQGTLGFEPVTKEARLWLTGR